MSKYGIPVLADGYPNLNYAKFEVVRAVLPKVKAFWAAVASRLVNRYDVSKGRSSFIRTVYLSGLQLTDLNLRLNMRKNFYRQLSNASEDNYRKHINIHTKLLIGTEVAQ